MPEQTPQHIRPSVGPVSAETAQLLIETLTSVFEWTGEDRIPAERRILLIRNACRVAIERACPTVYVIDREKLEAQFPEFLVSDVSLEAVAKITNDTANDMLKREAMSAAGFVRMCVAAGYTLAQGAVCARDARQVVPDRFDLMTAASICQDAAATAENWPAAGAFAALKNEAALDLSKGAI